jgi:hypothetical protein
VFGEVLGDDEVEHVSLKGCRILVVEGFDGCVLDGSVHLLGLAFIGAPRSACSVGWPCAMLCLATAS